MQEIVNSEHEDPEDIMETLNKDSVTQLFLQDFQIQHGCDVQEKDYKIRSNTQSMKLFLLFALDFWLCHLIIGNGRY